MTFQADSGLLTVISINLNEKHQNIKYQNINTSYILQWNMAATTLLTLMQKFQVPIYQNVKF